MTDELRWLMRDAVLVDRDLSGRTVDDLTVVNSTLTRCDPERTVGAPQRQPGRGDAAYVVRLVRLRPIAAADGNGRPRDVQSTAASVTSASHHAWAW